MTPLPGALGTGDVIAWRLDEKKHAATWDSGEGAFLFGGRWNGSGVRAVYCATDPSTSILEVAVHKGFRVLDAVPHVLSALKVNDHSTIHVVRPAEVPSPKWLRPGNPGNGQQEFGDDLLRKYLFVLIPSVVSVHSWNLIFDSVKASGHYSLHLQEHFALDPRLHPTKS